MDLTPEQRVERKRQLLARRGLLMVAVLIPTFALVDGLAVRGIPYATLVVRALWAAALVAVALRLPVPSRERFQTLVRLIAVFSAAALAVITQLTGGSQTMLFSVLPVLPLAVVTLTQDDGAAAWWTSLVIQIALLWILLSEGADAATIGGWILFGLGMAAVASMGASLYRKREALILEIEHARIRAVQQVAELERKRADSERLAVLGQLAAGVAHEINNPLAFVKANLFFLSSEATTTRDPEVAMAINEATTGVDRIEQIVRDLRAFSRSQSDDDERFELVTVVEEALRIASMRLKTIASTEVELQPGLPSLQGPRGRLLQVLINLLINAADALESSAQKPATAWVRVSAKQEGDSVVLTIEDNGPGLPPAVLARAFEPFFTTKPPGKGTGLGLALSREYIERFGGSLVASNRQDGGARFVVTLPVRDGSRRDVPLAAQPDAHA